MPYSVFIKGIYRAPIIADKLNGKYDVLFVSHCCISPCIDAVIDISN